MAGTQRSDGIKRALRLLLTPGQPTIARIFAVDVVADALSVVLLTKHGKRLDGASDSRRAESIATRQGNDAGAPH